MKLSVIKNNNLLSEVDFDPLVREITGEAHFYIGRMPSCHVFIDDKVVSREHAVLVFQEREWKIRKNSSLGDVFLNGRRIEEEKLNNGDTVQIGPYSLIVKISDTAKYFTSKQTKMPTNLRSRNLGQVPRDVQNSQIKSMGVSGNSASTFSENPGQENEYEGQNISNDDNQNQELKSYNPNVDVFADNNLDSGNASDGSNNFPTVGQSDDNNALVEGYDGNRTEFISGFSTVTLELFGNCVPFDTYTLETAETLIGRDGQECIIFLDDPEVSAVHARILKSAVKCYLEDLGSSNGTILNGKRIKREELRHRDEIIIGTTTITVNIISQFLKDQESRLMPVAGNQEIEIEQVVDVVEDGAGGASGDFGFSGDKKNQSLFSAEALRDPERRKKLIYIVIVGLLLWVFLDDDKPTPAPEVKKNDQKVVKKPEENPEQVAKDNDKKISPEDMERITNYFNNARELINAGKYESALLELDKLFLIDPRHDNARILYDMAKENFAEIERVEREKREEIERKLKQEKIIKLVEHAQKAVADRKVDLAESIFAQVLELDPNNFEIPQLRLEINAYVAEERRKEEEKKRLEEERRMKVDQLRPSKTAYLQQDWYRAIILLKKFLNIKMMDEDLITEATGMLKESQERLNSLISPLLGKARSLKEGQDLKGAYEEYIRILTYDPANQEAHNEMAEINQILYTRSRRIYRYGIISESLSLFDDAKQKFLEVQQVSPSDSEYYKKATNHLKEYWD